MKQKKFLLLGIATSVLFLLAFQNEVSFKDKIKYAGELIGMEFTPSEIDLMEEGIEDLGKTIQDNRKIKIDNSISPALVFNPLPKNFKVNKKPSSFRYSNYSGTVMPENRADLAYYSVGQLSYLIKTKKLVL